MILVFLEDDHQDSKCHYHLIQLMGFHFFCRTLFFSFSVPGILNHWTGMLRQEAFTLHNLKNGCERRLPGI